MGRKNLRKIPDAVRERIASLKTEMLMAAVAVKMERSSIADGEKAHLGIRLENGKVTYDPAILPSRLSGRYSRTNLDGKEIKLKDRPKVPKSWFVESPNWGDWGRGSHDVEFTMMVYQRRYIAPQELALLVELIAEEAGSGEGTYVFKVSVEEVLDRTASDFEDRLLFNLNLLQENVGDHGVFPSEATIDDYLATIYVGWEILPPGKKDANIARILEGIRGTAEVRGKLIERYTFLESLGPKAIVLGTNSFRRYFGAMFADDLVVFENIEYGNAIYVMGEDWGSLSKLSRLELLSHARQQYVARIIHAEGWQSKLKAALRRELDKGESAQ